MVRAKFRVTSITEFENGKRIDLNAVGCGSPENVEFFKWTPNANISLQTVNEAASKQFVVGKEYYVDFTPAVLENPAPVEIKQATCPVQATTGIQESPSVSCSDTCK